MQALGKSENLRQWAELIIKKNIDFYLEISNDLQHFPWVMGLERNGNDGNCIIDIRC